MLKNLEVLNIFLIIILLAAFGYIYKLKISKFGNKKILPVTFINNSDSLLPRYPGNNGRARGGVHTLNMCGPVGVTEPFEYGTQVTWVPSPSCRVFYKTGNIDINILAYEYIEKLLRGKPANDRKIYFSTDQWGRQVVETYKRPSRF